MKPTGVASIAFLLAVAFTAAGETKVQIKYRNSTGLCLTAAPGALLPQKCDVGTNQLWEYDALKQQISYGADGSLCLLANAVDLTTDNRGAIFLGQCKRKAELHDTGSIMSKWLYNAANLCLTVADSAGHTGTLNSDSAPSNIDSVGGYPPTVNLLNPTCDGQDFHYSWFLAEV
jgi:hypothetical protein